MSRILELVGGAVVVVALFLIVVFLIWSFFDGKSFDDSGPRHG